MVAVKGLAACCCGSELTEWAWGGEMICDIAPRPQHIKVIVEKIKFMDL